MPTYLFHIAVELHRSLSDADPSLAFDPPRNLDVFSDRLPARRQDPSLTPRASQTKAQERLPRRDLSLRSRTRPEPRACEAASLKRDSGSAVVSPEAEVGSLPVNQAFTRDQPKDWRFGNIAIEGVDMNELKSQPDVASQLQSGDQLGDSALAIKGKYVPTEPQTTDFGVGVVHLYREEEPLSGLESHSPAYDEVHATSRSVVDASQAYIDNDLTTLCILAVPSYMTPSDLLGWVGDGNCDKISHFRLIRTGRSNKYMVLLKFRESAEAKQWQRCWNGRLFNSMEPENCHVVFVRSIQFQTFDANRDPTNFPNMTNDPFKPTNRALDAPKASNDSTGKISTTLTVKPAPPPTASLIELPTCPVCLERMDDTTGLATIFCQHVFHCACLQKWRGSGCPVCRYTQDDLACKHAEDKKHANECETCGSSQSLWICLICGHTGCGRYEDAHAFEHYEHTSHAFAMDISTQHIWDYTGDEYVHRLIQSKADGALVELPPSTTAPTDSNDLPMDKLQNMSLEYAHLLTNQLDSQRLYFEEQVDRAVDKAAKASAAAEQAADRAVKAYSRLEASEATNGAFANDTVPTLERDLSRAERRATKAESAARHMQNEWREKGILNDSLMERIVHLEKQLDEAQAKSRDLEEQNRDLSFFISGMEKLKGQGDEVKEGTVMVAPAAEECAGEEEGGSGGKNGKKRKKKKQNKKADGKTDGKAADLKADT